MNLQNKTHMYCILILLITFALLTGCGSKESNTNSQMQENTAANSGEIMEENPEISAIMERNNAFLKEYMDYDREEREASQNSYYLLQEQEDAKDMEGLVYDSSLDDIWEGYNVVELGLLKPEQMPNCQTEASGIHFILYEGITYMYVNDIPHKENSIYAQYANVWCSIGSPEEMRVLGDLEEYGKYCAMKGDSTE